MKYSAIKRLVSTFGAIMALAGLEHGIGEILQGSVAPAGLVFPSWPDAPFFQSLSGEPAMSIIPNMLVTGIFAIILSLALLIWSTRFVQRAYGGQVMMVISVALLLFGGGIFPPVLAFIIGAVGTRIRVTPIGHEEGLAQAIPARIWPWAYRACVSSWLLLFPGVPVLSYFFGIESEILTLGLMLFAFSSLGLTIWAGFATDRGIGRLRRTAVPQAR